MIDLNKQIIEDHLHKFERHDLLRIQKALFIYRDIFCTLDECGNIWQNYSLELSASWLFVPDKLEDIVRYIEIADNFKTYNDWIE